MNGSTGIAVGMTTNIPPHNLDEIIEATIAIIDNPRISVDDLCNIVKAPIIRPAALSPAARAFSAI